jgi:hypothetical protein
MRQEPEPTLPDSHGDDSADSPECIPPVESLQGGFRDSVSRPMPYTCLSRYH